MYFDLKEPNSTQETLIVLRYYISKNEGRFVFSTGLTIHPQEWDKKTKLPIQKRGRSDLGSINRKLQEFIVFLDKTVDNFDLNKIPITKANLKERFASEFNKTNEKKTFSYFTDFVADFVEKAPNLVNRKTKRKHSKVQLKHYKTSLNILLKYESFCNKRIKINEFDLKTYDSLCEYLLNDQKYSINSSGEVIKNIKVFLSKAEESGLTINQDYKSNYFTTLKEESVSFALNEEEIESILNYDFSNNKRLENARDLFIIGLWTGLRVSDFLTLSNINVKDDFIKVKPQKTVTTSGISVVIPLHHHIKEVIKKRGMPHSISDVKFNKYIKEVCKEIGFSELIKGGLVFVDENTGDRRKKIGMYPKYKLVSSHICRRSFATNLYKMNFPSLSIMQITGHTTEKAF
ncbi:tyrosine-type recombinase/integrase [Tenacibaculum sp. SG-28]|uniref:tyrosine-type recombinase/integrase n=1 Tax=Tenacibaculum sp. SG-28 TaxID=754426 RepID=UPI000CF3A516|nr:tyrosine-type recombinase/integrase [Tenacibaculum sp. SG-28]PQJ23360.1 hypothetical protein BSU00_03980 [Tenacibaculum sp. SG-28]